HMGEQRNPNGSRTARPYGMTAGLKRTGLPYGRAHTASHGEATFMFDVRIIAACRRPQDAVQMCYRTTGGIVHPSITSSKTNLIRDHISSIQINPRATAVMMSDGEETQE